MSVAKRRRLDESSSGSAGGLTSTHAMNGGNGSGGGSGVSRRRAGAGSVGAGAPGAGRALGGPHGSSNLARGAAIIASEHHRHGPYTPTLSLNSLPVSALSRYVLHYSLLPAEPLTLAQATFPTPLLPFDLTLATTSQVVPRRKASLVPERRKAVARKLASPDTPDVIAIPPIDADMAPSEGTNEVDSTVKAEKQSLSGDQAIDGDTQITKRKSSDLFTLVPAEDVPTSSTSKPGHDNLKDIAWADPGEPEAEEVRGMTAFYGGEDQVKDRLAGLAKQHWDKTSSVKEGETIINFAYAIRMRSKILKSVPPL